jgi:hypothetical protein
MSTDLTRVADKLTYLDDHIEELRYVPRRQPVPAIN